MPKLTIDGRPVEVPDGTRVIQAARQIGIAIPTMCYLEGLEPFTSCMICQVKNEANGKMIPGCSALVEEGMKIVTLSDEVKKARKFILELLFSDHVGDCEAPCHRVCKSHINIPSMIRHIIDDDLDGAVEVLREAAGPTNLPCHGFDANAAWVEIILAATDLVAWAKLIGFADQPEIARCEIPTFRYRVLHVAARITRGARQLRLRIDATWRWAITITTAWHRIRAAFP